MAARQSTISTLCVLALAIGGCSQTSDADNGTHQTVEAIAAANQTRPAPEENLAAGVATQAPATVDSVNPAKIGGDGSQIVLNALSAADLNGAELKGELACSFSVGDTTLLLARGNVGSPERSQGLVKIAGSVERISAPGGYDAMIKGVNFAGRGKTVTIAVTGKALGGGESPASPATLTYDRADGAHQTLTGDWTCGP